MSRSGYTYDVDQWQSIMWHGQVASSIRGKRGQEFLRALLAAFDEMPDKRLIADDLERGGQVCAIGALGRARGVDMSKLDPDDDCSVAASFNIATPLACEIFFMNDELIQNETPEQRWSRMRNYVASLVRKDEA